MFENIRLSFQGIWSHKLRSFLTMLGIIIGIAAIIAIVSTIKGTNEQIKQNLIGSGNNTVEVKLSQGKDEYQTEYNGLPSGVAPVSSETLDKIRAIDSVENAALYVKRSYADGIFYQSNSLSGGQVYGIDPEYFNTSGLIIRQGRGFVKSDFTNYRKNVILDEDAASNLFQETDPIGKTLEIKGEPFTVIGIAGKSTAFTPTINSIQDYYNYVGTNGGTVYLPLSAWPMIYLFDEPEHVLIKATSTDTMSNAGQKTADILNKTISASAPVPSGGEEGEAAGGEDTSSVISYKAADLLEKAKNLQELSASTNQQLLWIASISLLVGGIGVMNIMLVSVTERTSEIGLKKAIGARNSKILGQFLTEAAVLTLLGGILGIIAGIALAQIISKLSATPVAISIPAIAASVIFSAVIGIIFGLLPSVKASKLNPIDALRHE